MDGLLRDSAPTKQRATARGFSGLFASGLRANEPLRPVLVARAVQERHGREPRVCRIMPLLCGTDGAHKVSSSYER